MTALVGLHAMRCQESARRMLCLFDQGNYVCARVFLALGYEYMGSRTVECGVSDISSRLVTV